jgi:hypothetical protein
MESAMSQRSKARLSVRALYVGVSIVFWFSVAGLVIGIPAGIATMAASDNRLSIQATMPGDALGGLPQGVDLVDRVSASLLIHDLSTGQIVVFNALIALAGLVLLFGLWQLRELVGSVREGNPFVTANVRRLRILGWILLLGYPIAQFLMGGINEWILSTAGPDIPGVQPVYDPFSLIAVFGGLCLLVLGEVFAHGIELREDVEATV